MDKWIIWCNLNVEQDALEKVFGNDAVSIHGSLTNDEKVKRLQAWLDDKYPILISKPSVLGFGLNLQCCHNAVYVGLSDSFEELDQSIHRIHRFGQQHECHVYVITSELEGAVVRNIERKRADHQRMTDAMIAQMSDLNTQALHGGAGRDTTEYKPTVEMKLPKWVRGN